MVFKEFKKRGRPLAMIKIRRMKSITPKGFKIKEINVNKIIFKKKINGK